MKLNREAIKGTIKEINWDRVAAIALTIGLVSVSGSMIKTNIDKKNAELSNYDSYSSQIESVYNVDIDSEKEKVVDELGKELNLVNNYNKKTTTDEEKLAIAEELNNERKEVKESILDLIKDDYAKEDGRSVSDYLIRKEDKGDGDRWEIYRQENGIGTDVRKLNSKEDTLVDYANSIGSFDYDGSMKSAQKLVDEYETAIKKAADHIGKTSDKAK